MEASIIFHFAGRGIPSQRLALIDFAQFLNPRWKAPGELQGLQKKPASSVTSDFLTSFAKSAYNFVQGGIAGSFGATVVYPIDLGELSFFHQIIIILPSRSHSQNSV